MTAFEALTCETLPQRLGGIETLYQRLGGNPQDWDVREVGDGNLNLVFIVKGKKGHVVVKQALPYVRLVGESWPLPLKRSFFEYHALIRAAQYCGTSVPEVYHFDETQALIVMEYLSPHIILRRELIEGKKFPKLGRDLGLYLARSLFRGSDLSLSPRQKKQDMALFADNIDLCDITENLVFSDPYFDATLNHHTSPQLDKIVARLRSDRDLKVEAQILKHLFTAKSETLLHGDLHTGSIMVTESNTRIIDPEFAFYGPMAFDIGMLLANFWMNYFAQSGHEQNGSRDEMRAYVIATVVEIWDVFVREFSHLWHTERTGILYQKSLFEDQGDHLGAQQALDQILHDIFVDALGFAGVETHRRILGLAHNADFDLIEDVNLRALCEYRALEFGRYIAVNRRSIHSLTQVHALAAYLNNERFEVSP